MITLSIPVAIFAGVAILQVGVVLGMWLKSVLSDGYDWGNEEEGGK